MRQYIPDRWCVLRMLCDREIIYKVFASWAGGYAGSESWKLNSGITQAQRVQGAWEFKGSSGSVYKCSDSSYGTTGYGASVLNDIMSKTHTQPGVHIEIMDENTDWARLYYDPLQQWMHGVERT